MTQALKIRPAPIRKTLRLRASPERAFAVFTSGMGGWWMKDHSLLEGTPQADVVIEPRAGGRWYEVGANGKESEWGRVLAWEPPHRLSLAWQLTSQWVYDAAFETTIEVTFTPDGDHTVVVFEHRDLERFGEAAAAQGESMDRGWTQLLDGFARAAEA
jgi:uncharacterized protein YndB with AHSA1/START domain